MSTTAADLPPKAAEFARILQEHMPELEREYGVASLALFGSYVRGEEREDSDLDVPGGLSRYAQLTRPSEPTEKPGVTTSIHQLISCQRQA